jgi:hypothetical protein
MSGELRDTPRFEFGGPVAAEPKMHLRALLLRKGLDPADAGVPDTQSDPNGTEETFHVDVLLG